MALTTFDVDVENITALADQPNDDQGLSADELKQLFDKAGVDIKAFLNDTLIPELEDAIAAAARGIATDSISGTYITDGTIPSQKLVSDAGLESVVTSVIRNYAVTLDKLSQPVQTILSNLQANVTNLLTQIDTKAPTSSLSAVALSGQYADLLGLPTIPVVDATLDANSLNPVRNSAVTTELGKKQTNKKTATATLASGTTSWSVSVSGVTSSNTVIATCAPASYAQWVDNRVRCSSQGNGTLGFTADTAPSANITVNILIFD